MDQKRYFKFTKPKKELNDKLRETIIDFGLTKFFPLHGGHNFDSILTDYTFNDEPFT